MDALIASDWSLDNIPCEWIVEVDDDLIDLDIIIGRLHQSLYIVWGFWHFFLIDDLLVKLINGESLHKVDGKRKCKVILDFSV